MHHEPDLSEASAAALGDDGPMQRHAPGFVVRPGQQQLAAAVAGAMLQRGELLAEAGTGTGKTFAYLVPALLSGQRVIVSTGTRALQDQLFHRDLPRVREALGVGVDAALLKGRANYVCWYRLDRARSDGRFATREQSAQLMRIHGWAGRSGSGDIAELDEISEDSPLWPQVTSTTENCLGSDCPFYGDCFVVKARARAQAADVVIVNHHLLLADLALKNEGFGELLPGAHAFVLDEAHQLPELAAQFFGLNLSSRQLQDLARDTLAETASVPAALAQLQEPLQALEQAVRELRLAFDPFPARGPLQRIEAVPEVDAALRGLDDRLHALNEALAPLQETSVGMAACADRASGARERLQALLDDSGTDTRVRWYELSTRGFQLRVTPLDVAEPLRAFRERSQAAWIFTSATLAVGDDFAHFAEQLGLQEPQRLLQPSPFDFQRQALCYLPRAMPDPSERGYLDAYLDAVVPVLQASRGRAFLLFTSHRALRDCAERLPRHCDFPLFVQGTQPRHALLQAFRTSGDGVLLGAASFWEGVDVAGEALSLVVIDKLPFAAPDDPVLEVRLRALRAAGRQPFRDWQLPSASLALKQGVGRLIRTHDDRGVVMLCDPRLLSRSYGSTFLRSLPPLPLTRELGDVRRFFAADCALHGAPQCMEHAVPL